MKTREIVKSVFLILCLAGLGSCVSTDVVEPDAGGESKQGLVLELKAPAEVMTRALDGYQLRYVAQIFYGSSSQSWGNPLDRKEIIDGKSDNRIVFQVSPGSNYTIMVFADYIPSEYTAGTNGLYQDYFYNTHTYAKSVVMRTTPGNDSQAVSPDFFNNDGYDCFFGIEKLYKDEKEVIVSMTLKRAAAQVKFREKSDKTGACGVSVDKLGVRKQFNFDFSPVTVSPSDSESNRSLGNITVPGVPEVTEDIKDVFYFYTLADESTSRQFVSIEFTVNKEDADLKTVSVKEIPVKRNYRTIVAGEYLPEGNTKLPDEEDPKDKEGDIILDLTTDFNWQQEELSK